MKKLLIPTFALAFVFGLTACQQPAEPKKEETKTIEQAPAKEGEHAHDHKHEHEGHDHNHAHGDHDHAGHDHHHEGEAYQCGDKKVNIVVHNHDGEMEAHATIDDIEYDLPADADKPNHYVTKEGLNDQGMTLHLEGDKATFTGADDKPLLDCQKIAHSH